MATNATTDRIPNGRAEPADRPQGTVTTAQTIKMRSVVNAMRRGTLMRTPYASSVSRKPIGYRTAEVGGAVLRNG